MSSGALFPSLVSGSRGSSSKYLVEFRAGKMTLKGNVVTPDKRKGMVYIQQSDDSLIHFCWKDRTSGNVDDVSFWLFTNVWTTHKHTLNQRPAYADSLVWWVTRRIAQSSTFELVCKALAESQSYTIRQVCFVYVTIIIKLSFCLDCVRCRIWSSSRTTVSSNACLSAPQGGSMCSSSRPAPRGFSSGCRWEESSIQCFYFLSLTF